MQKLTCLEFKISKVGLYLGFFGMLNQPDLIRSCHTILSIMKSRFGSLISQLSSPIFKEGSECKEIFWPDHSDYKRRLNFLRQGLISPLSLYLWSLEKEEADGAYVVVNFWPTPGSRQVSPPLEHAEDTNNKSHLSNSLQSIIWLFPRPFLLPRNRLSRGYSSFREHRQLIRPE